MTFEGEIMNRKELIRILEEDCAGVDEVNFELCPDIDDDTDTEYPDLVLFGEPTFDNASRSFFLSFEVKK